MTSRILVGDVRAKLAELPERSVHCVCTSPPYFGLRSYLPDGHPDKPSEIGLESTLAEYIATLVEVFRAVRRALRDDGTLWLNIGSSYGADKCDMMVPARLALALIDDAWILRSDIIWAKKTPMPESVTDRPTSAHEHVFLLAKRKTYFYDAAAVAEESVEPERVRNDRIGGANGHTVRHSPGGMMQGVQSRNLRNVWTLSEPMFRLRDDLSPEQRAYVFERLAAHERRGLA